MSILGDIGTFAGSIYDMTREPNQAAWNPSQQYLQGMITNNLISQWGQPGPQYTGQIAPGMTQGQQFAFQNSVNGAQLPSGGVSSGPGLQQLLSGQPAYQIDDAASAARFDEAVGAPSRLAYQDTMRDIDHRYGARFGRAGSQLENAHRAGERFNVGLAGARGQWMQNDEMSRRAAAENAMGRVQAGTGLAMQDASSRLGNALNLTRLGNMERGIQGQQNAEDFYKWQMAQPYNNPWLGFLGTALQAQPYNHFPEQSAAAIGGAAGGSLEGILSSVAGFM